MGKSAGSVRKTGGFAKGDATFKGTVGELRGLATMAHKDVYREVKSAISRYHSVLGVRQREVKLGDLPDSYNGVHLTGKADGKSHQIVLNAKVFDMKKSEIVARTKKAYETGWSTKTNKPIAHTVTHELAHATWNSHLKGKAQKAAGKEIQQVYKEWRKKKRAGYGDYSQTNVNEFFAEAITKRVHGKKDKWNKALYGIVKKYNL